MRLFLSLLLSCSSLSAQAAAVSPGISAAARGAVPASFKPVSPAIHQPLTTFLGSGLPLSAPRLTPEAAALLINLNISVAQGAPAASILAPLASAMQARGLEPSVLSGQISEETARVLSEAALSARQEVELQAAALAAESARPKISLATLSKTMRRMAEFGASYGSYFGAPAAKTFTTALIESRSRRAAILQAKMDSATASAQAAMSGTPTAEMAEERASTPEESVPANTPASSASRKAVTTSHQASPKSPNVSKIAAVPASLAALPFPLTQPSLPIAAAAPSPAKGLWAPETIETPLAGDPMAVTVHRLSNGMTVYLSPNRLTPTVTARVAVRAGSRQDPTDSTGMAHYLEHMLFKGTERLGTIDYAKEKTHLDRIAAIYEELFHERDGARRKALYAEIDTENQKASVYAIPNELDRLFGVLGFKNVNAHTNTDETVYEETFPSDRAEAWARIGAERFARPVFRLFQSELEAVYEEANMGKDDANRALYAAIQAGAFKDHPYGRAIIGLSEHLKNPSLAKMYAFYDAWYRPENMAVILSGDFDRAKMLTLLEANFGKLQPRTPSAPAEPAAAIESLKGITRREIFHEAAEIVGVTWQTVSRNHPDADALAVLERLLGDQQAGLLNLHLAQTQKIQEAGVYVWSFKEKSLFLLDAVTKNGQSLEEAEGLLMKEIEGVKAGNFTDEEVLAAVIKLEVESKERLESDEKRAEALVESYIAGSQWRHDVEGPARLRRVSKADVMRVAKQYLGNDRSVVYRRQGKTDSPRIAKPGFTPIEIDPTRQSALAAELTAAPEIEPRWLEEGKDYVVRSKPWGKLYWAPNPVSDLFSLKFVIPGGFRKDPRLPMAVKLFDASGAGDLTPADFERSLAQLGTKIELACGENECVAALTGLEANLGESLRLLSLKLARPNIPRGTLRRLVDVEQGALINARKNPKIVGKALREYAMHGTDSAVLANLSMSKLKALRTDELRRLLAGLMGTQRDIIYFGSKPAEEISQMTTFGRRRWRREPARAPRRIATPAKPRVIFIHHEGMVQAHIGLFASDGPDGPERATARRFYNTAMGGMGGIIFQEVREARALAYHAEGSYASGSRAGDDAMQSGWVGTQADKALEAAELMRDILTRTAVSPERYAATASEVEQYYRTGAIDFRDIPEQLWAWARAGFPSGDPRGELLTQAEAFKSSDLEAMMRRLSNHPLTIYVVSDRDKLDMTGLKKLGEFQEVSPDDIFPRL